MKVSVVICTWNRADLLDATLTQMGSLEIPSGVEWELLIVNNNCTDHTDHVLERHAGRLPLRRLSEPTPGLSHARNRAVSEVTGDLVVWTDDDVMVDRRWLAEYISAAAQWPDVGYFGGTIDPWFESEPPRWVVDNLDLVGGALVINQLGEFVGPYPPRELPYGANMAFRREHLTGRPFDTRLGYVRDRLVGGEDSDFIWRLEAEGVTGLWVGSARVRHFVPTKRMTRAFLWNWFAGAAQASMRLEQHVPRRTVLGRPLWAIRKWATHRLCSLVAAPFASRLWLRHYLQAARAMGVMREYTHREGG